MISVIWAVQQLAAYHTNNNFFHSILKMIFSITNLTSLLLAASMVFSVPAPAPAPGGLLDGLFKDAPLLGPLGGLGAGGLLATALGYKTKDSILSTINTIANVADAKLGLLNLGTNLVGTGLKAVEQIQGQPPYPQHQYPPQGYGYQPRYRPRYG